MAAQSCGLGSNDVINAAIIKTKMNRAVEAAILSGAELILGKT
jgi:hypothetical protein